MTHVLEKSNFSTVTCLALLYINDTVNFSTGFSSRRLFLPAEMRKKIIRLNNENHRIFVGNEREH